MQGTSREAAAEFLGTFILIVFGVGVVAQTVLSANANGSFLAINIGWGLAVMLGVYVAGAAFRARTSTRPSRSPWRSSAGSRGPRSRRTSSAQMAGAFVASAVVYLTYREAFDAFDGGVRQIAGAARDGRASSRPTLSRFSQSLGGFVDQVVGTALLMLCDSRRHRSRNAATPSWLTPVIVGGIVTAIGVAFGFNAGYAINPARDLGPRLFTAVAGWGSGVFTAADGWWWVPVVAPCVGAVVGALAYDLLVFRHHPTAAGVK